MVFAKKTKSGLSGLKVELKLGHPLTPEEHKREVEEIVTMLREIGGVLTEADSFIRRLTQS